MVQCFFHGTGQTADGVCVEIRMGDYRVLLDCGLRNPDTLLQLNAPDLLLCSHAHIDHSRSIASLQAQYPELPVYASDVTIALLDNPSIQALPWRTPIELLPYLMVQIFPAGHLPGAAVIRLTYTGETLPQQLLYCGDLCLSNTRLTEGLPLAELRGLAPDILIIEGSYGTDRHPPRRQLENQLMELLDRVLESGRSIVMPVPKLGLAQEILMLLRSHHLFSGRKLVVEVDEAIAQVCDRYEKLTATFPLAIQNFARYQSLFLDRSVRPYIQRMVEPLAVTADAKREPRIVLTTAIEDLKRLEQSVDEDWTVFLPHYRSGELAEFQAPDAEIYLLPDHCDGSTLGQIIHTLRPQHLILTHAPIEKLTDLAALDELTSRYKLHIPTTGQCLDLPIATSFYQPAPPETRYDGELVQTQTEILLSLPIEILDDPRWKAFADTGLIDAQWQNGSLVIRSISQREWLGRE
jgi:Cft2 family RNA processing exonuclease